MGWLKAAEGGGAEGAKKPMQAFGIYHRRNVWGEHSRAQGSVSESIWLWDVVWPPLMSPINSVKCNCATLIPRMLSWGWGKESQQSSGVLCWSGSLSSRRTQQESPAHVQPQKISSRGQAPGHANLLAQEPHFPWDASKHSWEQQWHLDHTSVGQALLFLCIPHHASADTTISLPGRTYDYPLNNLKQRDETSRPHCQIKQRAPRGLQVWNIGTALYGEGVTSLRPWFGGWLSKLSSSWDIPK